MSVETKTNKLSLDNKKFLTQWISGQFMSLYETIPKFEKQQLQNFKLFTPEDTIILYRGIYIPIDLYIENKKRVISSLPTREEKLTYSRNRFTSWTRSQEIAEEFANNDFISYVIKGKFKPSDILIDTTLLDQEDLNAITLENPKHLKQEEVIVNPGSYKVKYIIHPELLENKEKVGEQSDELDCLLKIIEINDGIYRCHKQDKNPYQFNFWITPPEAKIYGWNGGWIISKESKGKRIEIDIWDKNIKGKIGKYVIKSHTILNTKSICETLEIVRLLFKLLFMTN